MFHQEPSKTTTLTMPLGVPLTSILADSTTASTTTTTSGVRRRASEPMARRRVVYPKEIHMISILADSPTDDGTTASEVPRRSSEPMTRRRVSYPKEIQIPLISILADSPTDGTTTSGVSRRTTIAEPKIMRRVYPKEIHSFDALEEILSGMNELEVDVDDEPPAAMIVSSFRDRPSVSSSATNNAARPSSSTSSNRTSENVMAIPAPTPILGVSENSGSAESTAISCTPSSLNTKEKEEDPYKERKDRKRLAVMRRARGKGGRRFP